MSELKITATRVFNDLQKAWNDTEKNYRTLVLYGGSSSSKTISILQWLTIYAMNNPYKVVTLVGENVPVLKRTLIHDFQMVVMKDLFKLRNFNRTDNVYTFPNRSQFQFVSGDEPSKFHGPRRDVLYLDEIFYIPKGVYDQGSIRTREKVVASFNPRQEFWLREIMDYEDTWVHHSTYKDNPYAGKAVEKELERRMETDPNFFKVYGKGEWGVLDGLIFEEGKNWQLINDRDMPAMDGSEGELYVGLDFGYSIDPAAIIKVNYTQGEFWVKEISYKRHQQNIDIAQSINNAGVGVGTGTPIIADSAEPKSIQDLRNLGLPIYPSVKGADSVNMGITKMKEFKINVARSSINATKELRNYHWAENRQGETQTKPMKKDDHLIDALRYTISHVALKRPSWVLS